MREIRNDHPVARLIPALHLEVQPGAAARIPDSAPIPDGFAELDPLPTRAELLADAQRLSLKGAARMSRRQLADLITAHNQAPRTED